jgi:hypothetical protein
MITMIYRATVRNGKVVLNDPNCLPNGTLVRAEVVENDNSYQKVEWLHSNPDDPIWLYSELDPNRNELRKVEIVADGRMGYAKGGKSHGDTRLSECPLPSLSEIASDPQFRPEQILKSDFEDVWNKAITQ